MTFSTKPRNAADEDNAHFPNTDRRHDNKLSIGSMRLLQLAAGFSFLAALFFAQSAQAEERLLARNGNLTAHVEKGVCTESMIVTVRGPNQSDFQGDRTALHQLMAGVRTIMGLECPTAKTFSVIGQVDGKTVYEGTTNKSTGALTGKSLTPSVPTFVSKGQEIGAMANATASAPVSGTAANAVATPAAPSGNATDTALFKSTELPLLNNQIVSGFPVYRGTFADKKFRTDLAAHVDMAFARHWPELLDTPDRARDIANTILSEQTRAEYLVDCKGYGNKCAQPFYGWKGANEFEREASHQAFVKQIKPALASGAPALPLSFTHIIEVTIQPYSGGGFPISAGPTPTLLSGTATRTSGAASASVPQSIAIAKDKAPSFLAPLEAQNRTAYLAYVGTLTAGVFKVGSSSQEVVIDWSPAKLFLDSGLTKLHHSFADTTDVAQTSNQSTGGGFSFVSPNGETVNAALEEGRLPVGNAMCLGLEKTKQVQCTKRWSDAANAASNKIALRLFKADLPESIEQYHVAAPPIATLLNPVPAQTRLDMAESAFGPLTPKQKQVISAKTITVPTLGNNLALTETMRALTPFQIRRFWEATRASAVGAIDPNPSFPLNVRIYCNASLQTYDFQRSAFPLASDNSCTQLPLFQTPLIVNTLKKNISRYLQSISVPTSLPLPQTEAEVFWERHKGKNLVLTYDIDVLSIEGERFDQNKLSPQVVYRGNKKLFAAGDFSKPLYVFDAPISDADAKKPTDGVSTAAPLPDNVIQVRSGKFDALKGVAVANFQRPDSLTGYFDGSSPMGNGLPMTLLVQSSSYIQKNQDGTLPKSTSVFQHGSKGQKQLIAEALGIPVDHLVRGQTGQGMLAYYALPSPGKAYQIDIPESLDSSGRTTLGTVAQLVSAVSVPINEKQTAEVYFLKPETLYVLDSDPSYQKPDVPLHSVPATKDGTDIPIITFPPVAWHTAKFAELSGKEVNATLKEVMEGYSYNYQIGDTFAQIEAVNQHVAEAQAFDTSPASDNIWVTGTAKLADFEPNTGFAVSSLKLTPVSSNRKSDKPYSYITIEPSNVDMLSIKLPLEDAQAWKKAAPTFPTFSVRARVKPKSAEAGSGTRRTLQVDVLELELLDNNTIKTSRDPRAIRHVFDGNALTAAMAGSSLDQVKAPNPRREEIAKSDILGIRLGMSLTEVDKIIRQKMDVGWVTRLSENAKKNTSSNSMNPFPDFRLYISKDGKHQITVYLHPAQTDKMVGVARSVSISVDAEKTQMFEQLKQKYGNDPLLSEQYLLWTADVGANPKRPKTANEKPSRTFRNGFCLVQVGSAGLLQHLVTEDGTPIMDAVRATETTHASINKWVSPAGISVYGARNNKPGSPTSWDAQKWKVCGPTIIADVKSRGNDKKMLQVALLDLAAFADQYLAGEQAKKDAVTMPEL